MRRKPITLEDTADATRAPFPTQKRRLSGAGPAMPAAPVEAPNAAAPAPAQDDPRSFGEKWQYDAFQEEEAKRAAQERAARRSSAMQNFNQFYGDIRRAQATQNAEFTKINGDIDQRAFNLWQLYREGQVNPALSSDPSFQRALFEGTAALGHLFGRNLRDRRTGAAYGNIYGSAQLPDGTMKMTGWNEKTGAFDFVFKDDNGTVRTFSMTPGRLAERLVKSGLVDDPAQAAAVVSERPAEAAGAVAAASGGAKSGSSINKDMMDFLKTEGLFDRDEEGRETGLSASGRRAWNAFRLGRDAETLAMLDKYAKENGFGDGPETLDGPAVLDASVRSSTTDPLAVAREEKRAELVKAGKLADENGILTLYDKPLGKKFNAKTGRYEQQYRTIDLKALRDRFDKATKGDFKEGENGVGVKTFDVDMNDPDMLSIFHELKIPIEQGKERYASIHDKTMGIKMPSGRVTLTADQIDQIHEALDKGIMPGMNDEMAEEENAGANNVTAAPQEPGSDENPSVASAPETTAAENPAADRAESYRDRLNKVQEKRAETQKQRAEKTSIFVNREKVTPKNSGEPFENGIKVSKRNKEVARDIQAKRKLNQEVKKLASSKFGGGDGVDATTRSDARKAALDYVAYRQRIADEGKENPEAWLKANAPSEAAKAWVEASKAIKGNDVKHAGEAGDLFDRLLRDGTPSERAWAQLYRDVLDKKWDMQDMAMEVERNAASRNLVSKRESVEEKNRRKAVAAARDAGFGDW